MHAFTALRSSGGDAGEAVAAEGVLPGSDEYSLLVGSSEHRRAPWHSVIA